MTRRLLFLTGLLTAVLATNAAYALRTSLPPQNLLEACTAGCVCSETKRCTGACYCVSNAYCFIFGDYPGNCNAYQEQ